MRQEVKEAMNRVNKTHEVTLLKLRIAELEEQLEKATFELETVLEDKEITEPKVDEELETKYKMVVDYLVNLCYATAVPDPREVERIVLWKP